MNTTTITTNSNEKFNQVLNFLKTKRVAYLSSPTIGSITFFTYTTLQTNDLLQQLIHQLHLKPLQPSYAFAV